MTKTAPPIIVASPRTRRVAGRMLQEAVKNSAGDAVIKHVDDVEPAQLPALLVLMLKAGVGDREGEST